MGGFGRLSEKKSGENNTHQTRERRREEGELTRLMPNPGLFPDAKQPFKAIEPPAITISVIGDAFRHYQCMPKIYIGVESSKIKMPDSKF